MVELKDREFGITILVSIYDTTYVHLVVPALPCNEYVSSSFNSRKKSI